MPARTPSYRHHRPSGQAVVTIDGRDYYLGKHGSPESHSEYDRLVAEWLASGRRMAKSAEGVRGADLTVAEMVLSYIHWAEGYYRKGDKPTSEVRNIKLALVQLRRLYGKTEARRFGPLALRAVRRELIAADLCRTEINKRVRHVVRAFKWAASQELVPVAAYQALKTVPGLAKGRSEARESDPVKPVPEAFVEAVRPFVTAQIWAMVQIQLLTGMRPGEVCLMRTCDLDMSGHVWSYRPQTHKTEHHGRERVVFIGPRGQAVLRPWLKTDLAAYLFSPRDAMEAFRAEQRRNRKTPLTPSQSARQRTRKPKRSPGESYLPTSYNHAIRAACKRADVPHWHPHRLRHNAGTTLRRELGLDVAQAVLGHSSASVTELYAALDRDKARDAMARLG